jgi:pimeloyl-ACP methyl ester carboxylesterase
MTVCKARNGSVEPAYEVVGPPGGEPLLLIMGLDSPMRWWPDGFCFELADRGFTVARFDNRDTGRSSRTSGRPKGAASRGTAGYAAAAASRAAGRPAAGHPRRRGPAAAPVRRRGPGRPSPMRSPATPTARTTRFRASEPSGRSAPPISAR